MLLAAIRINHLCLLIYEVIHGLGLLFLYLFPPTCLLSLPDPLHFNLTPPFSQYGKVSKLTSDAKYEESDVKASLAALSFILSSAAKHSVDGESLDNELQQLGLPKGTSPTPNNQLLVYSLFLCTEHCAREMQ